MAATYWLKQNPEAPLFPDLLWSRPQNTLQAGKLLIIGGNTYGFAAVAEAYSAATKAGIGSTRVLLPQSVKKIAGGLLPSVEYAPNTPSGSFSHEALGEFLLQACWSDAVLMAGDLGRNSETAVVLDSFLTKHPGQITLIKDAVDYFLAMPLNVLERSNALLVLSMAQLQKLAVHAKVSNSFRLGMDLIQLVDTLHEFTRQFPAKIIVKHLDQIAVGVGGQVSTTHLNDDLPIWRVKTASSACVWWLQNPNKPFEALTTALIA